MENTMAFENEPTDPKAACLWHMQEEMRCENLSQCTNADGAEIALETQRVKHVARLRELYELHPTEAAQAEEEFEESALACALVKVC
jgi:hypothetical protein